MKSIKCPSCGSSVDPSSKFCEYCGSHFEIDNAKNENKLVKSFENAPQEVKDIFNKVFKVSHIPGILFAIFFIISIIIFILISFSYS